MQPPGMIVRPALAPVAKARRDATTMTGPPGPVARMVIEANARAVATPAVATVPSAAMTIVRRAVAMPLAGPPMAAMNAAAGTVTPPAARVAKTVSVGIGLSATGNAAAAVAVTAPSAATMIARPAVAMPLADPPMAAMNVAAGMAMPPAARAVKMVSEVNVATATGSAAAAVAATAPSAAMMIARPAVAMPLAGPPMAAMNVAAGIAMPPAARVAKTVSAGSGLSATENAVAAVAATAPSAAMTIARPAVAMLLAGPPTAAMNVAAGMATPPAARAAKMVSVASDLSLIAPLVSASPAAVQISRRAVSVKHPAARPSTRTKIFPGKPGAANVAAIAATPANYRGSPR